MTLKVERAWNCSSSSYSGQTSRKNSAPAVALKRYLDLTLRGTRQNLADVAAKGQKNKATLNRSTSHHKAEGEEYEARHTHSAFMSEDTKLPNWVNEMNSKTINHRGEANIFAENFLSYHKVEQSQSSPLTRRRPLSGVSTKSAPVVINGAMYNRPTKTHSYLQASRRPASAVQDRMTRAAYLRKDHQHKARTGNPSDSTKDELQRMKEVKPVRHELTKDLMPIPCHANETAHSFIIGARYNCNNFMDSRSFSRLGLYVPRSNPLGTFLKAYKGDETTYDNVKEREHHEKTSVRTGGSVKRRKGHVQPLGDRNGRAMHRRPNHQGLPTPHIRKVFKEAWLAESEENRIREPSAQPRGNSPVPPHPSPKPRPPSYNVKSRYSNSAQGYRNRHASPSPAFASNERLKKDIVAVESEMSRGVLEVE